MVVGKITREESSTFRRVRVLRLVFGIGIALAVCTLVAAPSVIGVVLGALVLAFIASSIYLYYWRCPRCGGFYCVHFVLGSFWPYRDHCSSCSSELEL
jgi:hypothetical protein